MMKGKILVTGASGFIGSFLCEELISRGYFVAGVDNFYRGKKENLVNVWNNKNFIFKKIDLAYDKNVDILNKFFIAHKIETLIHLSAINGTQYFYDYPLFVLDSNVHMTQNVLKAVLGTTVKYIIYASSSEVYSDPNVIPTDENQPILLNIYSDRDSYASSKVLGEFYTRHFCKKNSLEYLILRIFNVYGERMIGTRYGQVVAEFVNRMLFEDKFTILGNGCQTRSFCYINDIVFIISELLERQASGIINIGNDEEITILELADIIHQIDDRQFRPYFLKERPYDHKRRRPDITCLRSVLGGIHYTPLKIGLKNVIYFFKQKRR